jgi:hypothetical protein
MEGARDGMTGDQDFEGGLAQLFFLVVSHGN